MIWLSRIGVALLIVWAVLFFAAALVLAVAALHESEDET